MSELWRPGASHDVAIGAASVQSAAIGGTITRVRLVATSACYVAFGSSPTATKPGSVRLASNFPEMFLVRPGEKVAVIEDSAAGTLTITEMTR